MISVPPRTVVISTPKTRPGVNASGSTSRVTVPGRKPSSVRVFSSTMSSSVRVVSVMPFDIPVVPLVKITAIGAFTSASIAKSSGPPVPTASTMSNPCTANSPAPAADSATSRRFGPATTALNPASVAVLPISAAVYRGFSGTRIAPHLISARATTGHCRQLAASSPTRSPGAMPPSAKDRASRPDQSCN